MGLASAVPDLRRLDRVPQSRIHPRSLPAMERGSESLFAQITHHHERKNVGRGLPGLFGGVVDPLDWLAVVLMPVF